MKAVSSPYLATSYFTRDFTGLFWKNVVRLRFVPRTPLHTPSMKLSDKGLTFARSLTFAPTVPNTQQGALWNLKELENYPIKVQFLRRQPNTERTNGARITYGNC